MEEKSYCGKVYKIINKLDDSKFYIGSTTQTLKRRFSSHKSDCFNEKKAMMHYPLYCDMREYGIENFEIQIIETIENCLIQDLRKKEGEYQIQLNPVYNKEIAGRNHLEYMREYNKQFGKINKKRYRENHKEKIKEYNKKYSNEHKEEIKYRRKITNQNSYICQCSPNIQLKTTNKARHERSKKHQKYLQSLEETKQ